MSHSPDRQWWWDGEKWVPAVSPDRAWWFDGTAWVANAPPRTRRVPTAWTRPLQAALIARQVLGAAAGALLVATLWPAIREALLSQAELPAGQDASQFRDSLDAATTVALGVAGVAAAAILIVIVVGIVRRWTWLFWFLLVTTALSLLGIPGSLGQLAGSGMPIGVGGRVVHYPIAASVLQLVSEVVDVGLLIWMIQALRRYGPWAQQKVAVTTSAS